MNNKTTNILLSIIAIGIIVGLIIWKEFYGQSYQTVKTSTPFLSDIENKILISGNVYPNVEIEVKSSISGILEELYVEVGDYVRTGALPFYPKKQFFN